MKINSHSGWGKFFPEKVEILMVPGSGQTGSGRPSRAGPRFRRTACPTSWSPSRSRYPCLFRQNVRTGSSRCRTFPWGIQPHSMVRVIFPSGAAAGDQNERQKGRGRHFGHGCQNLSHGPPPRWMRMVPKNRPEQPDVPFSPE